MTDAMFACSADTTSWRCRRIEESARGRLLAWEGEREWPIETLSSCAILDRWGHGTYRVEFFVVPPDGTREKRGSQEVFFSGPPPVTAETFTDPIAFAAFMVHQHEAERAELAATARRALERQAMQHKADLDRERLYLAHALELERLKTTERIARVNAASRVQVELRLPDWLDPQPKKAPVPSKPN